MWLHSGICSLAASACCWLLSLFPKVFAAVVLSWAEYATLTEIYMHSTNTVLSSIFAILVLLLYVLSIYTYFKIIVVGAGSPLDFPELAKDRRSTETPQPYAAEDDDADTLLLSGEARLKYPPLEFLTSHTMRNGAPGYRWCSTCEVWKPDRCHHCSSCKRCFLRMDHHCPWFACCIGFRNHKFFIQLLGYITAYSGVVLALSTLMLYHFFSQEQYARGSYLSLNLVFLFVVSLAFFIAVGCFAGFLVYMVLRNTTTIEFLDERWSYLENKKAQYKFDANGDARKLRNIYDLGPRRNWVSIMGPHWYQWLLPVSVTNTSISGTNNGLNYDVDEAAFEDYCANLRLQDQLNAQLREYRQRAHGMGQ